MIRIRKAIPVAALLLGACSEPEPPSVLLITLDTTRADRLGAYGKEQAGTRNLDALAREGALFEWAFTTVPITLPAHASILTGTYPDRHGVHDNGWALPPESATLAEAFDKADYRTAAFVSAFPLYSRFGLDRGFHVALVEPGRGHKPGPSQNSWRTRQSRWSSCPERFPGSSVAS